MNENTATPDQVVAAGNPLDDHAQGILFVLVGPAGVGKNTIIALVMAKLPQLRRLPTATTREPRPEEQEGREHFFMSLKEFELMVALGELVEHQEVHPGKFYGTLRKLTHDQLGAGALLIADIDIIGAKALKDAFPDYIVSIFIAPMSMDSLEQRLRQRGNMPEEEIQDRLSRAIYELDHAAECDYRVINDTLDQCVEEVIAIIHREIARRGH